MCLYLLRKACPGFSENSRLSLPRYPPHRPHLLPQNQSKMSYLLCTTSVTLPYNFCHINACTVVCLNETLRAGQCLSGSVTCCTQLNVWHLSALNMFGKMKNGKKPVRSDCSQRRIQITPFLWVIIQNKVHISWSLASSCIPVSTAQLYSSLIPLTCLMCQPKHSSFVFSWTPCSSLTYVFLHVFHFF